MRSRAMPSRARLVSASGSVVNSSSRDLVGQHAVDLLGHVAIEAAQPRLHVNDRHAFLHRDQRAGDGRVDVADHQHRRRRLGIEHRLEAAHDLGGLHRVAGRADLEVDVRFGDAELAEEGVLHLGVVVLTGMQQPGRQRTRRRAQRRHDRCDLHEVRPGPHDAQDRPFARQ
jgi:hypothetical protein